MNNLQKQDNAADKESVIELWFGSPDNQKVIDAANQQAAETRKKLMDGRRIESTVLGRRLAL
jgi:hypothetical protein